MPRKTHDDSLETRKRILESALRLFPEEVLKEPVFLILQNTLMLPEELFTGILKTRKIYLQPFVRNLTKISSLEAIYMKLH